MEHYEAYIGMPVHGQPVRACDFILSSENDVGLQPGQRLPASVGIALLQVVLRDSDAGSVISCGSEVTFEAGLLRVQTNSFLHVLDCFLGSAHFGQGHAEVAVSRGRAFWVNVDDLPV